MPHQFIIRRENNIILSFYIERSEIMSDELKNAINLLPTRLVDASKSNKVLLIFDNDFQREKYKELKKNMISDEILITFNELSYHSIALVGQK